MTVSGLTDAASVEIAAPPDVVFGHVTDPALVMKWSAGMTEAKSYSDLVVGATAEWTFRINGREIHNSSRILDVEPPRLLVTEEIFGGRGMSQRIEIVEVRRGTSRVTIEVRNPDIPLTTRLLLGKRFAQVQREALERNLVRLKSLVEAPDVPLPVFDRVGVPARVNLAYLGFGIVVGAVLLWLTR